jgi:uncharacterized protein YjiS (DUF1127 family)
MTTQSVSSREVPSRDNIFAEPHLAGSPQRRFLEILREWRRRMRSRSELAALTDLDLKDIGYPAHAEAEKTKPFWRA